MTTDKLPRVFVDANNVSWTTHGRYTSIKELYRDPRLQRKDRLILKPLLDVFDAVRSDLGHPLAVTSGRRSEEAQQSLRARGYRAAKHSPHVAGVALDVQVPAYMKDVDLVKMFDDTTMKLLKILPRIGYLAYRGIRESSVFIHVDLAPLIWKQGDPLPWKNEGARW